MFDTPSGIYLRPEVKLVDEWMKNNAYGR
ncbi:MAG: PaRep2a protein [Pyrobaculum aerophilum]|nr:MULTISPECIES: PaRep2a protein [Pyrobaculum]MCX8136489.1 PaRep2a protein [Pyrobaculum aerophilum]